jgi:hypothetical protein
MKHATLAAAALLLQSHLSTAGVLECVQLCGHVHQAMTKTNMLNLVLTLPHD